eukprot:gnl/Dysnectes_brevis/919_a1020_2215.p1 GENE.gnl/Dysnectes_brevis/919_a1020_2215~~gnl/Dysnectes_brevis/919_a1020_2215.p1  ORF type:complete len:477 (-),score=143.76 gnl/Dysnectes_brevis/919_a1020_2215:105-1535(-)
MHRVKASRLLFLDVLRGSAIIGVVFCHAIIYPIFSGIDNVLSTLGPTLTICLYPLLLVVTWAGLFLMLSGVAFGYVQTRLLQKGKNPHTTSRGSLIGGVLLAIWHFPFLTLLSHAVDDSSGIIYRSVITGSIDLGEFTLPEPGILFFAEAMLMIGLSQAISAFVWGQMMPGMVKKYSSATKQVEAGQKRLLIFAVIIFALGLPAHYFLDDDFTQVKLDAKHPILVWLVSMVFGSRQPVFPMVGLAWIGMTIGMSLGMDKPYKEIAALIKKIALVSAIACVIGFLLIGMPDFGASTVPPHLLMLNTTLQLFTVLLCMKGFDFGTPEKVQRRAGRTRILRRFGMLSLTVYSLESPMSSIVVVASRALFDWELPTLDSNKGSWFTVFGLAFLLVGMWIGILQVWEKAGFKGSLEAGMMAIMASIARRGGKKRISFKLDPQKVIYNPFPAPTPEDSTPAVSDTAVDTTELVSSRKEVGPV